MGLLDKFDKEKIKGMVDKSMDFVSKTADKAVLAASDTAAQFKSNASLNNMSREDALALYNEKNANGPLKLKICIENFDGPVLGEFKVKTDGCMFKLSKGDCLELPMHLGEHSFEITYIMVKASVVFDFSVNTTLLIGVDNASNTMKVSLLDDEGKKIEGSENATKNDALSSIMKKVTISEDDSTAHPDAIKKLFGNNGQMFAYEDKVIIEREGTGAKMSFPFANPIVIPMEQIDSVLVSEPGPRGIGYVKICTKSNNGLMSAITQIDYDKYAVMTFDYDGIHEMKEYIYSILGK